MIHNEDQMPVTEDLMREHGLLNRILLIYEKIIHLINSGKMPTSQLRDSVNIIKNFIENYHEKIEEDYIFPIFEKHHDDSLTSVLREQHKAGRAVTAEILGLSDSDDISDVGKARIIFLLQEFIDMYRPHEAREDTELFPKVRGLISDAEFQKLSDISEDMEHEIFGEHGFTNMLAKVSEIEEELNIHDLNNFTPKE